MSKRIKLESIFESIKEHKHNGIPMSGSFCSICGEPLGGEVLVTEYACQACRHGVSNTDIYCRHCGEQLEASTIVEHYVKGAKFDDDIFQIIKGKIKK